MTEYWVVSDNPVPRARVIGELRSLGHSPLTLSPDDYDAFHRADMTTRLEVWVDCVPVEFSQHPRPEELVGLVVAASDARRVILIDPTRPDWLDDMAKVVLFDKLPVDEWNDPVCPRCRCDATVRTDEGLWWCGRHATRAWEPVEHVEGVAWQQQRMVG